MDKAAVFDPKLADDIPAWCIQNIVDVAAWMKAQCHENWSIGGIGPTATLQAKCDALERDARRLDWLAANMRHVYGRHEIGGYELPDIPVVESGREACDPGHLRTAIDALLDGEAAAPC